jgi:asparagine synthase (glutamine-hydrolysing)
VCGFIGRINGDGPAVTPLTAGLGFLRRRGPDSCHYWRSADGSAELIQARLAIVDADVRADQPFSDPRHKITIAFNGEIYNYESLRRELSDHDFRTQSDTEVLLAAFVRWGVDGLRRLRGMFACAIVDERVRRVYLVRDPVGKKPLFVAHWPGGTRFGSSLLALAATASESPALHPPALPAFWDRGFVPPTMSVLQGARPVAPGEVLALGWDGAVLKRADCFPQPMTAVPATFEEARERVAELLDQSLRRRLHNNPRPVSLLSGGTDSTVVASRMRRMGTGESLTLGSLVRFDLDEKYARYAAWRASIPLQVLRVQTDRFQDEVPWALDLQDEPLGMISFFPLALLLRTARTYGKILLTGDGGDEVFLGYGRPDDWTTRGHRAEEFPPADYSVVVGVPAPDWMSPWGRFTVGHSLLGHMLTKVDRASAEQGVEVRCPLLDWDLLALARSLPPDFLLHGGQPKGLLKSLLTGWPRWFVHRNKVGFAYRIRWAWGLRRYAGLREQVTDGAAEAFGAAVPACLRTPPRTWTSWTIFRNFGAVWKLLSWSRFARRLSRACDPTQRAVESLDGTGVALSSAPAHTA